MQHFNRADIEESERIFEKMEQYYREDKENGVITPLSTGEIDALLEMDARGDTARTIPPNVSLPTMEGLARHLNDRRNF